MPPARDVECNDPVTGEYLGLHEAIFLKEKRAAHFRAGFIMVSQDPLTALAADKELGGEALRIFVAIAGSMGYQNGARVSQRDLSERLGMAQSSVSRALGKLIRKGYVIEKVIGRVKHYAIAPGVAYKGRPEKKE